MKFGIAFLAGCMMQASAWGADPGLLSLVMPDAKVLAGMQVAQSQATPLGRYILTKMQPDDPGFEQLLADTGFNASRDLTEILMASNWQGESKGQWLVVARGTFNAPAFAAAVQRQGGTSTLYLGVNILASGKPGAEGASSVIAFPDPSRAIIGDLASVEAALERSQSGANTFSQTPRVNEVSAKFDFWFVTLVPVSEFAGAMPDQTMSTAMQGNLFQSILQASGGVKFGLQGAAFGAEVVTKTEKDAAGLVEVVKFLAGLLQTNKGKNATAAQVASLLDAMDVQAAGTTVTMALTVPQSAIDSMLLNLETGRQKHARRHTPAATPVP